MPASEHIRPEILWRIAGKLAALFVHEINNDLATLREKAGLADDVLLARKISDSDKLKSLGEIVNTWEIRLNQGVSLVHSLAEIGKAMESDSGTAELGSILKTLEPFLGKIARMQLLSFQIKQGGGMVEVRPYPLLCYIFVLFDNQCRFGVPGECIEVVTKFEPSSVTISFSVPQKKDKIKDGLPWTELDIAALTVALGNSTKYCEEGDRVSLIISRS